MQKTGRGEPTPLLDFEEMTAQIYKSTFHAFHTFRTWVISDSFGVTHWNGGRRQRADRGVRKGLAPTRRRKTLHRNKQTRVLCPASLDGAPRRALPHSIPLGHTFHDDMAPCRMGPGILRRSGRPYLSCSIDIVAPSAPVPFRGSSADRAGGFASCNSFSLHSAAVLEAWPRDLWPFAGPCSDVALLFL